MIFANDAATSNKQPDIVIQVVQNYLNENIHCNMGRDQYVGAQNIVLDARLKIAKYFNQKPKQLL